MIKLLCPLFMLGLFFSNSPALGKDYGRDLPNRFAILIGIEDYGSGRRPLQGASQDACALRSVLLGAAGFQKKNVLTLTKPGVCDSVASPPLNRASLISRIKEFLVSVADSSLLVVSYSGHGYYEDGKSFLRLSDDSVSVTDLLRVIREQAAKADLILLIDACRDSLDSSGMKGRSLSPEFSREILSDQFGREGKVSVFLSASPGESSSMRSYKPVSFFTWAIVKGLLGAAATADGTVTLKALVTYVTGEVPEMARYDFGSIQQGVAAQRPEFFGSPDAEDIQIARSAYLGGCRGFFYSEELLLQPVDRQGRLAGDGPAHVDYLSACEPDSLSDSLPLGAAKAQPGAPHVLRYRTRLPAGAHWDFLARITFGYGQSRKSFILCPASAQVGYGGLEKPEVTAVVRGGALIVDATRSLMLWWRAVSDFNADDMPAQSSTVANDCLKKRVSGPPGSR